MARVIITEEVQTVYEIDEENREHLVAWSSGEMDDDKFFGHLIEGDPGEVCVTERRIEWED